MPYDAQVIADGASHYWRLDETVGTTAADSIGSAPGTLSGGVTLGVAAAAGLETAMTFNGTTGKIVTTALALLTPFTIELWVKRNSNAANQVLFCNTWGAGDNIVLFVQPGSFDMYTGINGPSLAWPYDTAWHHLVCVCGHGILSKLYIDGATATSDITTLTFTGGGAKALEIGFDPNWSYFNGSLSDIALYPVALTPTQIANHYTLGITAPPPPDITPPTRISVYNLPTDNLAATGTPTLVTGAADAAYPLANAYDLRPDKPFKGSGVGPHRIVWDWGSARTLGLIALFNVRLDAALDVRFQMHTTDSWGSPDLDVPITIPAVRPDGRYPNVWLYLHALDAARYASLYIPANSVAPSIGEIWIGGAYREFRIRPGVDQREARPAIEHSTELGVSTVYDYGVTLRSLHGDLWLADDYFDVWWQTAKGAVRPSLIILDSLVNDVMLVRLASVKTHPRPFPLLHRTTIDATELSPGVPV